MRSCSCKLLQRFWQKAFAHLCCPPFLVEWGPICGPAQDKGGCLLSTFVPMCVLVCMNAATWCQPQIWAETDLLHTPATGHCVSAAGRVPTCTKPRVPTAVPSAFLTLHNWHTENHAVGVAGDVHTLLAVVPLCTSSHLGHAHPPTFGPERARACPARRVHACVSTAPAPSEGAL